jgi:hypothetical protein
MNWQLQEPHINIFLQYHESNWGCKGLGPDGLLTAEETELHAIRGNGFVSCKNRHFRGTYGPIFRVKQRLVNYTSTVTDMTMAIPVQEAPVSVHREVHPRCKTMASESLTLKTEAALTRTTLRNIPEDGILHSHCRQNTPEYSIRLGYRRENRFSQ